MSGEGGKRRAGSVLSDLPFMRTEGGVARALSRQGQGLGLGLVSELVASGLALLIVGGGFNDVQKYVEHGTRRVRNSRDNAAGKESTDGKTCVALTLIFYLHTHFVSCGLSAYMQYGDFAIRGRIVWAGRKDCLET